MKILLLCPYLPYPVISGGHTRVFNIIKHMSVSHQISLLAYNREPVTNEQREVLGKYCIRTKFVQRPAVWSAGNLFRYICSQYPFMHVINGQNRQMLNAIDQEINEFNPELVHVEHYHMAQLVVDSNRAKAIPRVISEQGVEYLILERMAQVNRNPFRKMAAKYEAARIRPFEIQICNKFDACIEVSFDDKEIIEKAGVYVPIKVSINGVDRDYFCPAKSKTTLPSVVFVGTFKFFGNDDAVRWLIKEVWPHMKKQGNTPKLYIVGNKPPSWLRKLSISDIIVTGWVPDVRDYINSSQVVVAPLRMGSGTKLKVLEAMSMAKPVVCTSVGAEGIGAQDGIHLVIRDDPKEFAQAVHDLLSQPGKAEIMGKQARQFILDNYSWEKASAELSKAYRETVDIWREKHQQ